MLQKFKGLRIEAISASVPKRVVNNEAFSHLLGPKEIRKFERTTGIVERRHSEQGVTASDLAFHAAKDVVENVNGKSDIQALIFVGQTSDFKIPFTSNILQQRLELPREILCLDINAGCAGFVQGLSTACALSNSLNGKVLLIVAETLSKILSNKDRTTATLFGDGAAALIIEKSGSQKNDIYFNFFSDGGNYEAIIIPDGGYRNPFSEQSLNWKSDEDGNSLQGTHLYMNGQKVFDFTLREIPGSIKALLSDAKESIDDIDFFLLHQSNKFIIGQITNRLQVPREKVLLNIHCFGNTSGVSIPLLIVTELRGQINDNKKLMLSGYGSGLNWGNCILPVDGNMVINELIEV